METKKKTKRYHWCSCSFHRRPLISLAETEASAIELPLPVRRFPVCTSLSRVKPMDNGERIEASNVAEGRRLPVRIRGNVSMGFTSEHERWALTMAHGGWRRERVFVFRVGHAQSRAVGGQGASAEHPERHATTVRPCNQRRHAEKKHL